MRYLLKRRGRGVQCPVDIDVGVQARGPHLHQPDPSLANPHRRAPCAAPRGRGGRLQHHKLVRRQPPLGGRGALRPGAGLRGCAAGGVVAVPEREGGPDGELFDGGPVAHGQGVLDPQVLHGTEGGGGAWGGIKTEGGMGGWAGSHSKMHQ